MIFAKTNVGPGFMEKGIALPHPPKLVQSHDVLPLLLWLSIPQAGQQEKRKCLQGDTRRLSGSSTASSFTMAEPLRAVLSLGCFLIRPGMWSCKLAHTPDWWATSYLTHARPTWKWQCGNLHPCTAWASGAPGSSRTSSLRHLLGTLHLTWWLLGYRPASVHAPNTHGALQSYGQQGQNPPTCLRCTAYRLQASPHERRGESQVPSQMTSAFQGIHEGAFEGLQLLAENPSSPIMAPDAKEQAWGGLRAMRRNRHSQSQRLQSWTRPCASQSPCVTTGKLRLHWSIWPGWRYWVGAPAHCWFNARRAARTYLQAFQVGMWRMHNTSRGCKPALNCHLCSPSQGCKTVLQIT